MQKPAQSKGVAEHAMTPLLRAGFCKQSFRKLMDIDAFILIGGQSSRFGSPKAFAELDGQTLAARAARTVETAISPRSLRFVVGSEIQFPSELVFGLGRPVVADLKPGFGAWSGLHTAVACSSSEWTIVLACDLPFVSAEFIGKLAALTVEDVDAIVPRQTDERPQPLCAFYRRSAVLPEIEARLAGSKQLPGITAMFSAFKARIVEPNEYSELQGSGKFFVNVNCIGDLPS